jgi:hypothetical protein
VIEDVILVPEVQARRALGDRPVRLQMLVPIGAWIGCGRLRVLRLKINEPLDEAAGQGRGALDDKEVELTVGYESYRNV